MIIAETSSTFQEYGPPLSLWACIWLWRPSQLHKISPLRGMCKNTIIAEASTFHEHVIPGGNAHYIGDSHNFTGSLEECDYSWDVLHFSRRSPVGWHIIVETLTISKDLSPDRCVQRMFMAESQWDVVHFSGICDPRLEILKSSWDLSPRGV